MTVPDIPDTKIALRLWAGELRLQMPLAETNAKILAQLTHWPHFRQAQTICAYWAKADELDISPLFQQFPDKTWYLPRVYADYEMKFHRYAAGDLLEKNKFGIQEPMASAPLLTTPWHVDLILLPGLLFDCHGNRLGYGQGYYDRALDCQTAPLPSREGFPILAGITADALILPKPLPVSAWDIPVRYLVTETKIHHILSALQNF